MMTWFVQVKAEEILVQEIPEVPCYQISLMDDGLWLESFHLVSNVRVSVIRGKLVLKFEFLPKLKYNNFLPTKVSIDSIDIKF